MYNAVGARVVLDGCLLRLNAAGGEGLYQANSWSYDNDVRGGYEASKAAHIFTSGRAQVTRTVIEAGSNFAQIEHAAQRWIIVGGGTLFLDASNFSSAAGSDPLLWLLASSTPDAEILIRQCSVRNLKLQSAAKVGVVNSEFEPPLNSSVFATFQQGECARVVANEQMCDPRAQCDLRLTAGGDPSGVQCSCVGNGLRYKPGVSDDGRQCEQGASLRAVLESESVAITVAKPGSLTNRTLTLIVQAHGEAELNVTFDVSMTRFEASSGALIAVNGSMRVDRPSISAFGLHLEWQQLPPPAMWRADLDGSQLKYAGTSRHEFTVRLECERSEHSCAADGDDVTTVVLLASNDSLSRSLRSEVRIVTNVQSLLSCKHTRAAVSIEPDFKSVPISSSIRVQVFAKDADNLPVSFTRAEISLKFGCRTIPMQWSRGSNEYVADVPAELTAQPGVYDLVVSASSVWNVTKPASSCELARRTITVKEGVSTNSILTDSILGGAGGAAIVVIGGLLIVVRKRRAHLQAIMLMLFTEVSHDSHRPSPLARVHARLKSSQFVSSAPLSS